MTNDQLIKKAWEWVKSLCDTGGRSWTLRIPAHDEDPDLVFTELCTRLEKADQETAALKARVQELESALGEMLEQERKRNTGTWNY